MLSSSHLHLSSSPFRPYSRTKPHPIRAEGTASTRSRKKRPARKPRDPAAAAEEAEVVRQLLRRTNGGNETIISVLNKNVKVVRTEHCFLLFEELGKRDGWLQCLEVFRWMQRQRWYMADNGIFSKLISVMGKKGQIRMAMWLFSQMRNSGCRPDTSVYNSLITAHLHSRDKTKALSKSLGYFEKMKSLERCQPNIVTYNILLRAFAQASDFAQVETLFKDLESSGITPDVYTFNGVMDAFGKNGMLREMEGVLVRMKGNNLKPDVITFNTLIDAYGKKQVFDKMEQVFKSLLKSKQPPSLPTFHCMITNYAKARQREKAEMVFTRMECLGFKPSNVTYDCLITMYGYCDCVSRAREVFDEMLENSEKEIQVSTLNAMLDAYCNNGLPSEANELLNDVIKRGIVMPNSSTYKLLYKAYTRAGRKDLLDILLKKMDQQGIVPNKKFFLDALETFGSSGSTRNGEKFRREKDNSQDYSKDNVKSSRENNNSNASQENRRFIREKDNSNASRDNAKFFRGKDNSNASQDNAKFIRGKDNSNASQDNAKFSRGSGYLKAPWVDLVKQ
ncbi:hypothetical protein LUZ60_000966 [Juncus effusus]|nr:hypothetical protein LUZ60_000966 [Juncus effusus]